jgi:hypothetical protein
MVTSFPGRLGKRRVFVGVSTRILVLLSQACEATSNIAVKLEKWHSDVVPYARDEYCSAASRIHARP